MRCSRFRRGRLEGTRPAPAVPPPPLPRRLPPPVVGGTGGKVHNPATGAVLAELTRLDGPAQIEPAMERARAARPVTGRPSAARRAAPRAAACGATAARAGNERTGRGSRPPVEYRQAHPGDTGGRRLISGAECLGVLRLRSRRQALPGSTWTSGPAAFGATRRRRLGELVAGIGAWNYPLQIAVLEIRSRARLRQCHAKSSSPPSSPRSPR